MLGFTAYSYFIKTFGGTKPTRLHHFL